MVSQAALRLVKSDDTDTMSDRRCEVRYPVGVRVTAVQTQESGDHQNKICSLQLLNLSHSGLGAIAQEPVAPGSRIAIYFPPHGPERGFDLYGYVVRCVRREYGHEVGVQFNSRMKAA